jgi:hypothetical protein
MSNLEEATNKRTYVEIEIPLEKIRIQGRKMFGRDELANMKLERFHDFLLDAIVYQWSTICSGEKVRNDKKEVTFTYPANWFEHMKFAKYFPKWLKQKYPIKWKVYRQTVEFKEIAVFPKLSDYLNIHGKDRAFFMHTECLNNDGTYDCNMNIMEEK